MWRKSDILLTCVYMTLTYLALRPSHAKGCEGNFRSTREKHPQNTSVTALHADPGSSVRLWYSLPRQHLTSKRLIAIGGQMPSGQRRVVDLRWHPTIPFSTNVDHS